MFIINYEDKKILTETWNFIEHEYDASHKVYTNQFSHFCSDVIIFDSIAISTKTTELSGQLILCIWFYEDCCVVWTAPTYSKTISHSHNLNQRNAIQGD